MDINLLEGTFSFHVLFDNSVCDLCVFWTAGQEAGGCPGRPEGQSLPWHVTPSSHQGWPRASPKSPLLKDRLGIGVPGEWHSPVFYLVFNSSLLHFASSQEFSCCSSCTVPTILGTGGQSGCAIPGCSCWVGRAPFLVPWLETSKTCPRQTCLSQLHPDLRFHVHVTEPSWYSRAQGAAVTVSACTTTRARSTFAFMFKCIVLKENVLIKSGALK